jgi:deoxycytidylate deaminase
MYCPWAACGECARAIIQCGIKKLVVHKQRMDQTPERWLDNVLKANKMLVDCGVVLQVYDGPVGGNMILVNGEEWQP